LEKKSLTVKELPLDDRPREKLLLRGAQNLSDAELIAILLRTGTKGKPVIQLAQELLKESGGLSTIAVKTIESLTKFSGIGKDKAVAIAAAFELGKRIDFQKKWFAEKKISSPADVADIFIPILRDELKEKFIIVCLSSANKIIKWETISVGTLNSSVVHAREIFKAAVENSSASIILLHNHPSGNPEPSNEDIAITRRLIDAGKVMDIPVFDHIIIAGNKFTSLVDKRII
jgi:DNA repair protein RadC